MEEKMIGQDTENRTASDQETEAEEKQDMTPEEARKKFEESIAEVRKRAEEARDAMKEGKGRLKLQTPIESGDEKVEELAYDFTTLTGVEYTDAMDSDPNSQNSFRITYRQALALFAKAAAKESERLDMRDITEKISAMDAVEGVQLASLFFNASTRAGQMRISKK
jgi:hypothetical protein